MSPEKNPLKIYHLLPQTNCGECYLPSCLAFAAAVTSGSKKLTDCPHVTVNAASEISRNIVAREPYEIQREENLAKLQKEIEGIDLGASAKRLGARMAGEKLVISCLGKDFSIDSRGNVTSVCHTHYWLTIPLLSYVIDSRGSGVTGTWIPFRELKDGPPMNALFEQRGEKRLQRLADSHPELFTDIVSMFSGTSEDNMFSSDVSVVLHPLPKLPILICYWKLEDDLDSKLNIFFDATADSHLKVNSIFELSIGMIMMFDKIARMHR